MPRYVIHRKDRNHAALVALAERLGMTFYVAPPLDGWAYNPRRKLWMCVEIKHPDREGHADEYTPLQRRFFERCKADNAPWWVWRTEADVVRDWEGNA